jgi:hypothetical protein
LVTIGIIRVGVLTIDENCTGVGTRKTKVGYCGKNCGGV